MHREHSRELDLAFLGHRIKEESERPINQARLTLLALIENMRRLLAE